MKLWSLKQKHRNVHTTHRCITHSILLTMLF